MYKITLADGTIIDNVQLNASTFVAPEEFNSSIMTDKNLSPTIIENIGEDDGFDANMVETGDHPHMRFIETGKLDNDPGYPFCLIDIPEEEVRQKAVDSAISFMAQTTLTEEQAAQVPMLFPEWDGNGVEYSKGTLVQYDVRLAKCLQDHKSQPDWAPGIAPSLWTWVSDPGVEYPDWVQPVGAHDAYSKGAKVTHNGKKWVSDADGNVWEPGQYGWTELNTD